MILHTITFVALLVSEVSQAPIVVQCAPSVGQDPLWSRLLVTAIPSILALGIAWMAFHWNSQKDQRRWVLDNRKAEWQKLLVLAAKIEQFMPSVAEGHELTSTVHDPAFRKHLREMTQVTLERVFISADRAESIYKKLLRVQMVNEESKGHIEDYKSNANQAHLLGKPRPLMAAKNVQVELISLWREIRQFASNDLEAESAKQWASILPNWAKRFGKSRIDDVLSQHPAQ